MSDKSSQEPSMEDILSSIRRIISEGDEPGEEVKPAAEEGEEEGVLELTKMVDEDGNLVDVSNAEKAEKAPAEEEDDGILSIEAESEGGDADIAELEMEEDGPTEMPFSPGPAAASEPEPMSTAGEVDEDGLLSPTASAQTAQALAQLAHRPGSEASAPGAGLRVSGAGKTLEDYVIELLRPMLKEWLDDNLPRTVERLVQKEIQRVSRQIDPD